MRDSGPRRLAPALAVLLVALLAGLSLGSGVLIARHLRADATAVSRLFIGVIAGLNDPEPGAAEEALLRLGEQVRGLGIPIVVTDGTGRVTELSTVHAWSCSPITSRITTTSSR